ncbi:hypothetical protein VTN77DRAFT_3854 [Rasamsonia byssochlamydoides]|uniref:uncharacterized protein n=1 Tax=Rasamsonia byssochlamydoides TaxID=89139 RepID=UPI0037428F62
MSASAASDSHPPPTSPTARAGRLRRLSQLRAYTQSYLTPHSSSSSPSSSSANQRSYRNSLTRVVGLHSASSSSESPTPQSTTASTNPDPRAQTQPSESSRSAPSHDPQSQLAGNGVQKMASAVGDGLVSVIPDSTNGQSSATSSQNTATGRADSSTPDSRSVTPKPKQEATIRFFPYQDPHHSSRPSLPFAPMSRTLPSEDSVIRVGRYSERDGVPVANPSEPSDAPIGFKSKVVSRKHCEFSFSNGQWYIKDVGSSSGTFLNRMRLSQPNMESRLYAVRDGDIVQLGIDFRGGEEMIFRCVRIRIECNRSWQQRPNEFNKNTEALIKNLGKGDAADDFAGCRECSICLGSVLRPYQCLFMAACAHVWHYKCIRRLIHTPDYPMFQCPNCRAWTDLSAEVDSNDSDDEEKREASKPNREPAPEAPQNNSEESHPQANGVSQGHPSDDADLAAITENMRLEERGTPGQEAGNPDSANNTTQEDATSNSRSANIPIPARSSPTGTPSGASRQSQRRSDTPANAETFEDNPMTPRNDNGLLAFDGRAGRL